MAIETPNLDNRRFQDIVDEAKALIPHFCPEWTEHNVSDPGVALIELFAWMTDLLLYRVNQVPDSMYIKFLELIGVSQEPPRASRTWLTFYLSAPPTTELPPIPAGTEVATVRTETDQAIIFTTEEDLHIRPAVIVNQAAYSWDADGSDERWLPKRDLKALARETRNLRIGNVTLGPKQRAPHIEPFPTAPSTGDAFYLPLEQDHSHHVLALILECEEARNTSVVPTNPPIAWEVSAGGPDAWARCAVEKDTTGGLSKNGEIVLRLPRMAQHTETGVQAYWLRAVVTQQRQSTNRYDQSPAIQDLWLETRGGTAVASQMMIVTDELIEHSDGKLGQTFRLRHTPVLRRDTAREYLVVEPPGAPDQVWQEVENFAYSTANDRHYTLDSIDGTLVLGPELLQPDGRTVYRFSQVLPKGSRLRFTRYRSGAQQARNVPPHTLTILKSSIPYINRVTNWQAATGGANAQSLADVKLHSVPRYLRTHSRAVTRDDFEYIAGQIKGVARAHCLAPGKQNQPRSPADVRPGQVIVVVLPAYPDEVPQAWGEISPTHLELKQAVHDEITDHLNKHCVLGTSVVVRQPEYVRVTITATLHIASGSGQAVVSQVQERALSELYRCLNPYVGGTEGAGWPFGRKLRRGEVTSWLERIPDVQFAEVQMSATSQENGRSTQHELHIITVPEGGLICSAEHRIEVKLDG